MTYLGSGTYVMKSSSASTREIDVDGESFFLIGNLYHLVIVKKYSSYDPSLISTVKVPNGTISISIP